MSTYALELTRQAGMAFFLGTVVLGPQMTSGLPTFTTTDLVKAAHDAVWLVHVGWVPVLISASKTSIHLEGVIAS